MPNNVNLMLAFVFCFSGFTDAMAVSSTSSEASRRVAEARDSWLAAFKSKDVGAAVGFYGSDAAFLQPSGDRIGGIEAIRELYQKVVSMFDTDLVLRSRNLEVSANLAYDSGEYEETLTNRTTGTEATFSWAVRNDFPTHQRWDIGRLFNMHGLLPPIRSNQLMKPWPKK